MAELVQAADTQRANVDEVAINLRNAARAAEAWHLVHLPKTKPGFQARVQSARRALKVLEVNLAKMPGAPDGENTPKISSRTALIELQGNVRLLRGALSGVLHNDRIVSRLPRVIAVPEAVETIRAAKIAEVYLQTVDCKFTAPTLIGFLSELQTKSPLAIDEIWSVAPFLKFVLLELMIDEARNLLRNPNSSNGAKLSARLLNLRAIANSDWASIVEPLIILDGLLRQDPARAYANMDFDSRELYRRRIAFVARYSDCTEMQVAKIALDLAKEGASCTDQEPRVKLRRMHVGYYLIGKGFSELVARIGYYPPLKERARRLIRENAEDFYITGIQLFSVLLIASTLFPVLPRSSGYVGLIIAFILLAVPATQDAVDLINNAVSALFDPEPLPKLDFSTGIPADCTTLVAVPSLLFNEKQVRELALDLEVRFLANRDRHLHFALLTDLPDAVSEPRDRDSHPLVDLAIHLIEQLNRKYASTKSGTFLLLHRHRVFNRRQGVWMGWERKRGKLLDLNKLLTGEFDAFPMKAGNLEVLREARYVLTLDSDTQLPRGAAARLIGAMAHPLNQAVIHPKLRIVTEGYGILQPRIGIAVQSASRSRLASIYSGQSGFDIYTRAISDAYQDLFSEGIFTGKGIYEISVLHSVLDRRFPRNALLSHDLIEGAYARAGQVTDVELIDDYPSHYSAYSRRKHRWVRGDWQIVQWMFSHVPDESGRLGVNPISSISRWKIFDNLRRSLLDPALLILFVAGWIGLPGGPLYWTALPLFLLAFPAFVQLCFAFARKFASDGEESTSEIFSAFGKTLLIVLLNLIFLPHQMLLAFDAIIRSLVRRFVTGERLLEWETAAQAEAKSTKRTPVDRYLVLSPLVAIGLGVLVYFVAVHRNAILFAAPILVTWALASAVTAWLNRPPKEQSQYLSSPERTYLTAHALLIWRYFNQFGVKHHNYLIPDNVEEEGLFEAARVSPTNIGLLLNARQAACELGFLTVPEYAALTQSTLETINQLEKFRGHLFNWYSTETLKPLDASPFVSSVDSGNLVASLYTLKSGTLELLERPLISLQLFNGLRSHWGLLHHGEKLPSALAAISLPHASATLADWIRWLPAAEVALHSAIQAPTKSDEGAWWQVETLHRVRALRGMIRSYSPWLLPEYESIIGKLNQESHAGVENKSIENSLAYASELDTHITSEWSSLCSDRAMLSNIEDFRSLVSAAVDNLSALISSLYAISSDAERQADATEFAFLADPGRQILSIGYDMAKQKTHEACYDMLASEARIATFLAVARGDIRQESWFRLAREFAEAFGHFVLLSWSGTMFEYMMPALWMRSFPNTLVSKTQTACVAVQRDFGNSLGIPWGVSESGSASKDDSGHYQYKAYGVPQIALWFEADAGPIISPYSTFLALGVECREALHNLRRMELMGWVGAYGFYESADYRTSLRKPEMVREWMAHHQGMALLSITNLLCENVVQKWFHANPLVQSAELLLHELPTSEGAIRARLDEFASATKN